MKHSLPRFIPFFLLTFILATAAPMALGYNNTYAVIIGVSKYRSLPDCDLNYAAKDARDFARFLQSKQGGSVPSSNIVLLTDNNATKQNIIDETKKIFRKAKKDDRVIFYFSGHGDKGCVIPNDVTIYGSNILYFSEIKALFKQAKCNTKLMFADSCHSGSLMNTLSGNPTVSANVRREQSQRTDNINIAVMMSCDSNQTSLERPSIEQGLFTYYLIKGLKGEANRDSSKYITIQELYYYVKDKVTKDASPHEQTPILFGNFELRLIVGKC